MIIAVHEVELHILVNSGRSHAKSVLGVADCAPSGHLLLGSGAWCGESSEWIHGPDECFCGYGELSGPLTDEAKKKRWGSSSDFAGSTQERLKTKLRLIRSLTRSHSF